MQEFIVKNRDIILLTIGSLLVLLSLCLIFYDRVELIRSNVFAEIEMEKYRENNLNGEVEDEKITEEVEAGTDIVDDEDDEDIDENETETSSGSPSTKTNSSQSSDAKKKAQEEKQKRRDAERAIIAKEYIGYLVIKKINLNQGLVSKNSFYNDVKYNVQIIEPSNYPDKSLGNLILAAHSGTGYYGFFKNLYKLVLGDEAQVLYKGYTYTYKIVDIYNVPKNGIVNVNRDVHKTCLTLITCTHDSKTEQTVYILELTSKVKDGG